MPKLKFTAQLNENAESCFKLRVYKNKKLIIKIDNPSVKERLTLESALLRLEIEAGRLKIDKLQMYDNDQIFNMCSVNEFKALCNKLLRKIKIAINDTPQTINSQTEKLNILKRYHDDPVFGGHAGQKRMYAKIRSNFFWKNMSKDIVQFVKKCDKCHLNKPKPKNTEPMQITPTPQKFFDTVVIDTIGPFKKSQSNNQYAVTAICDLTKFLITIPVPNKEAKTIAEAIFEHAILLYGPMKNILTDRGTEYKNQLMNEICRLLNISQRFSTAYHHETLGSIERNHRILNEYLRSYISENQDNWDEYLKYFTYCYNITPSANFKFKFSPFELVFARKPNIPEFLMTGKIDPVYNFDNYAIEIKYRMQLMHELAQKLLKLAKLKNKEIFDKSINSENFCIGDKVLLRNEDQNKLNSVYKGPFKIKEINGANATIYDETNKTIKEVHKNRLVKINN